MTHFAKIDLSKLTKSQLISLLQQQTPILADLSNTLAAVVESKSKHVFTHETTGKRITSLYAALEAIGFKKGQGEKGLRRWLQAGDIAATYSSFARWWDQAEDYSVPFSEHWWESTDEDDIPDCGSLGAVMIALDDIEDFLSKWRPYAWRKKLEAFKVQYGIVS